MSYYLTEKDVYSLNMEGLKHYILKLKGYTNYPTDSVEQGDYYHTKTTGSIHKDDIKLSLESLLDEFPCDIQWNGIDGEAFSWFAEDIDGPKMHGDTPTEAVMRAILIHTDLSIKDLPEKYFNKK